MPLETATTIDQLVGTNPPDTDPISQAGAHLRLIKTALQGSFPGVVGATTATTADLNSIHTNLSALVGLLTDAVRKSASGTATLNGGLSSVGTINANVSINQANAVLVPRGIITLWWGSVAAIPAGWTLCNGLNGTPDLRDRFIVAAGGGYAPGALGGSGTGTAVTDVQGAHSHTGATAAAGSHSHGGITDVQGIHNHSGFTSDAFPSTDGGGLQFAAGSTSHFNLITSDGGHDHNLSITAVGNHAHGISTDGGHAHNVAMTILPPYAAFCYIMKT